MAFSESVSATVTFNFAQPITAFGIAVNDMNFGSMSFADNLGNSYNEVLWGDNANGASDNDMTNRQFFGVTNSDAFTSVELAFVNTSGLTGTLMLDYLQYGESGQSPTVPVPGAAWLVGSGLVCLFRVRKRTNA